MATCQDCAFGPAEICSNNTLSSRKTIGHDITAGLYFYVKEVCTFVWFVPFTREIQISPCTFCEVTKAEVGTGHEIPPKLSRLHAAVRSLKLGALSCQKCHPLEGRERRDSEHPDAWVSGVNSVA